MYALFVFLQGWPYCGRPKEKGFLYEVCYWPCFKYKLSLHL